MTLDDLQKKQVRQWIDDGLKVADIQKKLEESFGLSMTYMEVRFLVDDLGVMPKDDPEPEPEVIDPAEEAAVPQPDPIAEGAPGPENDLGELVDDGMDAPPAGGKVSVTIDQLARPGMRISGKVTFSDQQSAGWYLDDYGQLGLSPDQEGYKPSQNDLMEFQMALQAQLSRGGF